MALTSVDFTTTFNYVPTTKLFKFTDVTDYPGQGVSASSYEGLIKVTAPTGLVIYNNTNWAFPDILPGTSPINTTTIPLPLDGSGNVLQGSYTFLYTVSSDNGVTTVTKTYTYTFSYTRPSISITTAIDYNAPLISGTDATNYTVNTITPTVTRAFSMAYPASVNITALTGTNNILSTSTFYVQADTSLQYTFTLISTLSYNFGSNLYVSDVITGTNRIDAFADANLCQLYCGLRSAYNRWQAAKGTSQGDSYKDIFDNLMAVAALLQIAYNCGEGDDVSGYISVMKAIANFDECECSDSTPVLVTGLGGTGTIVVAAGSGIAVDVATGGSSTTYIVSIEPTLLAKLNLLYNTVLVAGPGIEIYESTSGYTKTYTVSATLDSVQQLDQQVTIDFVAGALPTITEDNSKVYGNILKAATISNVNNGSVSDWNLLNNLFTASVFFTGPSYIYYPYVQLVFTDELDSTAEPADQNRVYELEIVQVKTNSFDFRLRSVFGSPVNGNSINETFSSMTFLIKITV